MLVTGVAESPGEDDAGVTEDGPDDWADVTIDGLAVGRLVGGGGMPPDEGV